jgi:hypothetical protein
MCLCQAEALPILVCSVVELLPVFAITATRYRYGGDGWLLATSTGTYYTEISVTALSSIFAPVIIPTRVCVKNCHDVATKWC